MTKFIFVTGGVTSSLGKGITAASLGRLLKSRGLSVTIQKLDPYLNVDPGTMSPFPHGYVHVTLVPYIAAASELKTKPTQHSVKELRSIGIQPDFIVCRSDRPIDAGIRRKIGLFCDVDPAAVVSAQDAPSIYQVPLNLREQQLDQMVIDHLGLECGEPDMTGWETFVRHSQSLTDTVRIALVGKYVQLPDAYLSVHEALKHAGIFHEHDVKIDWVDAEGITVEEVDQILSEMDGILVPGGFGVRGIEGKIRAACYAREGKVPYFGICLGMQVAVAEFARNVAGLPGANSTEFDPVTPHPVIDLMRDQESVHDMGGTMRLGAYPCAVTPGTKGWEAYGEEVIYAV